jgi:hypothetical protein
MKTIEQIMNYEPLIAKPEYGTEPSLAHLLETYYLDHNIEPSKAKALVSQYIQALEAYAK